MVNNMIIFIYSYKGYTITNKHDGEFQITYPNENEPSVYTYSLEKAYQFVNEMGGEFNYEI